MHKIINMNNFFNKQPDDEFKNFIEYVKEKCNPLSMIRDDRFVANAQAIEYILDQNIQGDIVEVGVWKGGSIISMLMTLQKNNALNRNVHLYDTFSGMTPHTDKDFDKDNRTADSLINSNPFWLCISSLDEVKNNIKISSDYPEDLIKYHVGDICKNEYVPEKIAFLRLDTDWYESTKCELEMFYNSVASGGVIMLDDYGHWQGCRRAVDEFLKDKPDIKIINIDYTGVFFIKP